MIGKRSACGALALVLSLAPQALAQVVLRQAPTEDKTYKIETSVKFDQTLTIGGTEFPTTVSSREKAAWSVGKKDADGNFPITVKNESSFLEMNIFGAPPFTFDSTNPKIEANGNPVLEAVAELSRAGASAELKYVLDAKGKVLTLEGSEKVLNEMSPAARKMGEFYYNADRLKKQFEQEVAIIPDKAVKPGDVWERKEEMPAGVADIITFHKEYKYAGTVEKNGKTLDRIEGTLKAVDYEQDPNAEADAKITNAMLRPESSKEEILYDRKEGMVVEKTVKCQVAGTIHLSVMGMDFPDTKLSFDIEVTTAVAK